MKPDHMQFKSAGFGMAIEGEGLQSGELVIGYASVFNNIDLGDDRVIPGAYRKTLAETPNVPVLWQHHSEDMPIGKTLLLQEDSYGLIFQARIEPTRQGLDARILVKSGAIQSVSIGYEAKTRMTRVDGRQVRDLEEIKLYEISLVNWAMNPLAQLTSTSSANLQACLKDSLLIAQVEQEQKRGIPVPERKLVTYLEAQQRRLERALYNGKTARQLLYEVSFELQELAKKAGVTHATNRC